MSAASTVFVVDDDQAVRDSLAMLVHSVGLEVETFESAGEFPGDASVSGIAAADVSGDGVPDVVVTSRRSHMVSVLVNRSM